MSIVNRRNAVIGWGAWKLGKSAVKWKAKSATPGVEKGRPNKSLLASAGLAGLAGLVGALTFWRRSRADSEA
jgi:hypothetical protein